MEKMIKTFVSHREHRGHGEKRLMGVNFYYRDNLVKLIRVTYMRYGQQYCTIELPGGKPQTVQMRHLTGVATPTPEDQGYAIVKKGERQGRVG